MFILLHNFDWTVKTINEFLHLVKHKICHDYDPEDNTQLCLIF